MRDPPASSYLVVKLVIQEVFPQGVGEVQDGGDDDAKGKLA